MVGELHLPPNFDKITTLPSLLSKIKLASRNVSNYSHLQTDFHSMVMKMLKYCQNLVEDEVLQPYNLENCLLYQKAKFSSPLLSKNATNQRIRALLLAEAIA